MLFRSVCGNSVHGFRVDVDEGGSGCRFAVLDLRRCWCAGLRGNSLKKEAVLQNEVIHVPPLVIASGPLMLLLRMT